MEWEVMLCVADAVYMQKDNWTGGTGTWTWRIGYNSHRFCLVLYYLAVNLITDSMCKGCRSDQ